MKKWMVTVGTALVTAALSTILTNLITGQPLAGLVKLEGLSRTLLKSSVPAWVFAVVLFVALFGVQHYVSHFPRNAKGKIHFVPDGYNSGWSRQDSSLMELRVSGMFTYDGEGTLTILKVWLEGTSMLGDMMTQLSALDGSSARLMVSELALEHDLPVRAVINLRLKPALGVQGRTYRGRLVFLDRYNKRFVLEPVDFPYIGPK